MIIIRMSSASTKMSLTTCRAFSRCFNTYRIVKNMSINFFGSEIRPKCLKRNLSKFLRFLLNTSLSVVWLRQGRDFESSGNSEASALSWLQGYITKTNIAIDQDHMTGKGGADNNHNSHHNNQSHGNRQMRNRHGQWLGKSQWTQGWNYHDFFIVSIFIFIVIVIIIILIVLIVIIIVIIVIGKLLSDFYDYQ